MDQLDLIDIYRTFHPKTMNFTFFSSAPGDLLYPGIKPRFPALQADSLPFEPPGKP